MRLMQASDLHYSPSTLDEVDRCFGFAVNQAIAGDYKVAVLSGDLFDHRVELHSPCVAALLRRVHQLANHMPVLVLQGTYSHDAPGCLDVFKTIAGKHPVAVADRICQMALMNGHWMESDGWAFDLGDVPSAQALFSCLPSINKAAVAAMSGAENAGAAVGEHIHNLLTGWAPIHQKAHALGVPTVVVSHGTVSGSVTEHGVPMAGLDNEYTTGSLFASGAGAIMLGHIHQHQVWNNGLGQVIAYPGSIGRLHFGETKPKGFLLWSVHPGSADCSFIETPARRLVQIEFPGAPNMDELKTQAIQAQGAHVRIRYTLDEEHRHAADKDAIIALFEGAAEVKIEARINPIQRTRAEGMNRAVTLADKLAKWCETTDTEPGPLVDRVGLLTHMEPEAIVESVLHPEETKKEAAA